LRLATWNLNNRVGKVPFPPEAVSAAIALDADVLVFTELFPLNFEIPFRETLAAAGWPHQLMSPEPAEVANRVLVASRVAVEPLEIALPTFDQQFPANLLPVRFPESRLSVLAVRVPAYAGKERYLLAQAWEWLETTAGTLKNCPTLIMGDLNASLSKPSPGREYLRRILDAGWTRATPAGGAIYFGRGDQRSITSSRPLHAFSRSYVH
jgi:hypothetical protein